MIARGQKTEDGEQISATLVADSRRVQAGDIFFAYPVPGAGDGRDYIAHAIAQGASSVFYEAENFAWNEAWQVPHVAISNLMWQSGFIARDYLNRPDKELFTIAVTGTNGKTSCTQWIAKALSLTGMPCSVIGTLGAGVATDGVMGQFDATGFTTPDALQLHEKIATFKDAGVSALALEASSIGLEQGRLNGMHIDTAIFTNFTRDHLDFHGDMARYEAAKTHLFEWPQLKTAIINLDDALGVKLATLCQSRGVQLIGYGIQSTNELSMPMLKASHIRSHHGGTHFQLESPFGSGTVKTQTIGRFNISNMLAVLATLFVRGASWRDALAAVEQLTPVAGRMEQITLDDRVLVMIDYAHTPDALEKTLQNLKNVAMERKGKLWCVFGCGGDRDPGKRPEMGKIAEKIADQIVITSDNPRSEQPDAIIAQIASGLAMNHTYTPVLEPDRAKAILYAIKHAENNDVVLVAGKGHEAYQEIQGKRIPFSDKEHAQIALASIASKGVGL